MKTILALCLAIVGLAGVAAPQASARETAPVQATSAATLPATARVNATVVVSTWSRYHHRRFHTVRRVYYRHGRRIVVVRRVYY